MKLMHKLALTLAATALGTTVATVAAPPAQAADSSWGCGGMCRPGMP